MSAINKALSQLAENKPQDDRGIQRAEVKPVKQRSVLPWVVGSFALSLAVGGWAISQQAPSVESERIAHSELIETDSSPQQASSPTTKTVASSDAVYQAKPARVESASSAKPQPEKATKTSTNSAEQSTAKVAPKPKPQPDKSVVEKPILVAKVASQAKAESNAASQEKSGQFESVVMVEQVELTPKQLAEKAVQRAEKALDANNLKEALIAYNEVLRYTPSNENARKKLSALYYGKGEVRKSVELLQKGIALNSNDVVLRVALAKLLVKEEQSRAALTVLSPLSAQTPVDYLSLRAALAQKLKQNQMALESYQHLVELEPDSGRWWLGLAIQQERAFELELAKKAYQQAQTKLGLSSQSQQFIRDRLVLIDSLNAPKTEE